VPEQTLPGTTAPRLDELVDLVDTADVGLHWVGPDGAILWANAADHQLLGYARDEYVGRNIAEFHDDQAVIADVIARLARGERITGQTARLRHRDGSLRHVLISSSARFDEGGRFLYTRCFTVDVTECAQEARERERVTEELALRTAAREEQITEAAHDLRGPLAHIALTTKLLLLESDAPEGSLLRSRIQGISHSAAQMSRLLSQLFSG
jgi:PAS domain S-box-containing protein